LFRLVDDLLSVLLMIGRRNDLREQFGMALAFFPRCFDGLLGLPRQEPWT
jgi:hypothetical protein